MKQNKTEIVDDLLKEIKPLVDSIVNGGNDVETLNDNGFDMKFERIDDNLELTIDSDTFTVNSYENDILELVDQNGEVQHLNLNEVAEDLAERIIELEGDQDKVENKEDGNENVEKNADDKEMLSVKMQSIADNPETASFADRTIDPKDNLNAVVFDYDTYSFETAQIHIIDGVEKIRFSTESPWEDFSEGNYQDLTEIFVNNQTDLRDYFKDGFKAIGHNSIESNLSQSSDERYNKILGTYRKYFSDDKNTLNEKITIMSQVLAEFKEDHFSSSIMEDLYCSRAETNEERESLREEFKEKNGELESNKFNNPDRTIGRLESKVAGLETIMELHNKGASKTHINIVAPVALLGSLLRNALGSGKTVTVKDPKTGEMVKVAVKLTAREVFKFNPLVRSSEKQFLGLGRNDKNQQTFADYKKQYLEAKALVQLVEGDSKDKVENEQDALDKIEQTEDNSENEVSEDIEKDIEEQNVEKIDNENDNVEKTEDEEDTIEKELENEEENKEDISEETGDEEDNTEKDEDNSEETEENVSDEEDSVDEGENETEEAEKQDDEVETIEDASEETEEQNEEEENDEDSGEKSEDDTEKLDELEEDGYATDPNETEEEVEYEHKLIKDISDEFVKVNDTDSSVEVSRENGKVECIVESTDDLEIRVELAPNDNELQYEKTSSTMMEVTMDIVDDRYTFETRLSFTKGDTLSSAEKIVSLCDSDPADRFEKFVDINKIQSGKIRVETEGGEKVEILKAIEKDIFSKDALPEVIEVLKESQYIEKAFADGNEQLETIFESKGLEVADFVDQSYCDKGIELCTSKIDGLENEIQKLEEKIDELTEKQEKREAEHKTDTKAYEKDAEKIEKLESKIEDKKDEISAIQERIEKLETIADDIESKDSIDGADAPETQEDAFDQSSKDDDDDDLY